MSEIGEECSLCGRQCDPGILLDRVCPWCYNPAPPASDDVREIVAKARGCGIREYADGVPEVAFTMTDDAAAALISAHIAKEMAELQKALDWVRSCSESHANQMRAKDTAITALTAKVERMREAGQRVIDAEPSDGAANNYPYIEHAMMCRSLRGDDCDCGIKEYYDAMEALEKALADEEAKS
jgi:hypothetical protein